MTAPNRRDFFAGSALQGLLARCGYDPDQKPEAIAFMIADAMLVHGRTIDDPSRLSQAWQEFARIYANVSPQEIKNFFAQHGDSLRGWAQAINEAPAPKGGTT